VQQFDFSLKWLANLDLKQVPSEALCAIEAAVSEEKRRRLSGSRGANLYRRRDIDKQKLRVDYSHTITNDLAEDALEDAWVQHFNAIMSDDWSKHFVDTGGPNDYYVYLHFDPRVDRRIHLSSSECFISIQGEPFYVGKGIDLRAYDLKRNDGHGVILRQLRAEGYMAGDVVRIVASGLTEAKSLEIESKLIHFFGSRYDKSNTGPLVNLAQTAGPVLKPVKPKLLRAK
jgi:hypothetical protein